MPPRLLLAALAGAAVVALLVLAGLSWNASRLPSHFDPTALGAVDLGGGSRAAHGGHGGGSITSLREPVGGAPDVRVTIAARKAEVRLPSGRTVKALTFGGTLPGSELRVREGDLIEATLVNEDVEDGVSIHWHGQHVPNAEDGVAGVTQDAVPLGGRHVYRFRARPAGTYWYHSHQRSAEQVERGLYGAFVVLPRDGVGEELDLALVSHTLRGVALLGDSDVPERRKVAAGTTVRLRLANSDDVARRFALVGTPFRLAAVDGAELAPGPAVRERSVDVPAGGRADLVFVMPPSSVSLLIRGRKVGLALSPDGKAELAAPSFGPVLDPADYAAAASEEIGPGSRFDRTFTIDMGQRFGFFAGRLRPGRQWTINGKTYPKMPMLMVGRDELVKIAFANNSDADHPMHLHGHHMLVLSRNGEPVRTPWLADTLDVRPGERYEVAVRTTNPGLWMLHCHNLEHAAHGLTTHLAYHGFRTPFEIGKATPNQPE